MGELKDTNRDDLLNRFASHTFTETVLNDLTQVEFKDGGSVVVAEATKPFIDDAYQAIRRIMVEGGDILIGDFTFQGSTKFGGLTTEPPNGSIDVVGTDLETARIRNIRYQNGAAAAAVIQAGHSRGTEGTPLALSSGDRIGSFMFIGNDGGGVGAQGPAIRSETTEAWTGSARGGKIMMETINNGSTTQNVALTLSENGFPVAPSFVVAGLPTVEAGGLIYVSDETGGATLAFSDGTNWRRVQDRAIVA